MHKADTIIYLNIKRYVYEKLVSPERKSFDYNFIYIGHTTKDLYVGSRIWFRLLPPCRAESGAELCRAPGLALFPVNQVCEATMFVRRPTQPN